METVRTIAEFYLLLRPVCRIIAQCFYSFDCKAYLESSTRIRRTRSIGEDVALILNKPTCIL